MTDQYDDLYAAAQRATRGPWVVHPWGDRLVATAEPTDHFLFATEVAADASFVVAARNALPALIDENRRLREALRDFMAMVPPDRADLIRPESWAALGEPTDD